MLSDPQTVTVGGVAKAMPRVETNGTSSKYRLADETFELVVSHDKSGKNRLRSVARINQRAVVADPLTAENDYQTLSFYGVLDRPVYGFTATQIKDLVAGFQAWLNAAMVDKIIGSES